MIQGQSDVNVFRETCRELSISFGFPPINYLLKAIFRSRTNHKATEQFQQCQIRADKAKTLRNSKLNFSEQQSSSKISISMVNLTQASLLVCVCLMAELN